MKQVEIIRSNRKTMSVEISNDLKIIVRAPLKKSKADIIKFLKESEGWIEKHLEIVKKRVENTKVYPPFSYREIWELKKKAYQIIPAKVDHFAKIMGVRYQKITFRAQKTRWGSCSTKASLNFNCILALCPDEIIDYIVIHELCHITHMNHSKSFWLLVEKYCPNFRECNKWLDSSGKEIIARLKNK